jgi:hypothetical protein
VIITASERKPALISFVCRDVPLPPWLLQSHWNPGGKVLGCGKGLPNIGDLNQDNPWELLTAHLKSEGFDGSA